MGSFLSLSSLIYEMYIMLMLSEISTIGIFLLLFFLIISAFHTSFLLFFGLGFQTSLDFTEDKVVMSIFYSSCCLRVLRAKGRNSNFAALSTNCKSDWKILLSILCRSKDEFTNIFHHSLLYQWFRKKGFINNTLCLSKRTKSFEINFISNMYHSMITW